MLAHYILVALVSPSFRPPWAAPSTSPPAPVARVSTFEGRMIAVPARTARLLSVCMRLLARRWVGVLVSYDNRTF
ncbi:hypothetical protein BD309DRAFT_951212, partial [Dichomitus squalens]